MSTDDELYAERCCCGHLMRKHQDALGPCRMLGCDCPHWAGQFSDDHLRRTPRIAVDLKGPRGAA